MPLISIKVDLVASLRYRKYIKEPDPAHAAVLAELAGADGINCYLREDRQHVRDRDLYILKETVKSKLTLQIAPDSELVERAIEVKPYQVTLMPFLSGTSVIDKGDLFASTADDLRAAGICVGYFIKPEIDEVKAAARGKANIVEFDCSDYARAEKKADVDAELERLEQAAQLASKLGMAPHCGNGLNYRNIRPLCDLDIFEEFTVGHAIISRAVMVGLDRAVGEMAGIVHTATGNS